MATFTRAVRAVKSNVTHFLPEQAIRDAAAAVGHRWRQRKLGPVATVLTLVLQLLWGNASLAHARAVAGGFAFTPSALCQARGRLPLALLTRVLDWLVEQAGVGGAGGGGGGGPRVLLVDAFNGYTHDTPALRRTYRRPRQQQSRRGADYPQVRTLGVFDLRTGLLLAQHHFAADRVPPIHRRVPSRIAATQTRAGGGPPRRHPGVRPRAAQLRQPVPAAPGRRAHRGAAGAHVVGPPGHSTHARDAAMFL
jgi:hypothetical protein